MDISTNGACALVASLAVALGVTPVPGAATGAVPRLWQNCTNLHVKYPHGVGKAGARDRTRGSTPAVTTFKRSTRLYNIAMEWNKRLDADKDGVACEKR